MTRKGEREQGGQTSEVTRGRKGREREREGEEVRALTRARERGDRGREGTGAVVSLGSSLPPLPLQAAGQNML